MLATVGETGLGDRSLGDSLAEPRKLQLTERCAPLHLKQTCLKSHPEQWLRGEIYSRNPSVQTKSEVFAKRFARLAHYLIYAKKNFANVTTIPNERSPMEPVRPAFGAKNENSRHNKTNYGRARPNLGLVN